MLDYKKILKSPETINKVLRLLDFIPDKPMLKIQYRIKTGKKLDLKNPKRFNEKLQVYKLKFRKPVLHQCADKYDVREYVKSIGLEDILINCFGVFEHAEDVDFDKLPDRFVLKKTTGGGSRDVLICKDKSTFDIDEARKIMHKWVTVKDSRGGREWAYKGLKPRIIAEEYLENPTDPEAGVSDYKHYCYGGKLSHLTIDSERYTAHKRAYLDKNWNKMELDSECTPFEGEVPKPKNLEKMFEIAEKLAEGFPFVRVDLYNVEGKIYFGELTFYPGSGYVIYTPDEWDYKFGENFNI